MQWITNHEEHFWKKIKKPSPDACWEWTRSKNRKGYGNACFKNQKWRAHRLAFFLAYKTPLPSLIMHSCDNPSCCNPLHLFPGTPAINSRDMVSKKRNKHGSRHYRAKLKEKDVIDIRKMIGQGVRHKEIAIKYGVHKGTISAIKNRTWKQL